MRRYGLLGKKLSHSFSPQIHKYFYDDKYELFEVEEKRIENFLKSDCFDGINVTIPYKKVVMPYCDELSDIAKELGNVNTILKRADGTLYGDNTDYFGFLEMAKKSCISFCDKKVLILGSGGAGTTAKKVAIDEKAREVIVISRQGEDNYDNIKKHADADIIINATPVGMYPDNGKTPVKLKNFNKLCGVLDLIYNPSKTALILEAEELGIPCSNGLWMLCFQALRAAEIFSGNKYELSLVEKIVKDIEKETKNIILIGMPGCGKSTVGKALSKLLNTKMLDTDEIISKKTGKTPSEIIKADGEKVFRKIETKILEEVSKLSGMVIATGGGIVTREENLFLVKQNSYVVFLERELSLLECENRPISQKEGVSSLYEKRKDLYKKFSDITVKSEDIKKTAKKIKEMLNL